MKGGILYDGETLDELLPIKNRSVNITGRFLGRRKRTTAPQITGSTNRPRRDPVLRRQITGGTSGRKYYLA